MGAAGSAAESPEVVPEIAGTFTKGLVPFKDVSPAEIHFLHSPPLLQHPPSIPTPFLLF